MITIYNLRPLSQKPIPTRSEKRERKISHWERANDRGMKQLPERIQEEAKRKREEERAKMLVDLEKVLDQHSAGAVGGPHRYLR